MTIADEVRQALLQAGLDVSGASLTLTFTRDNRVEESDAANVSSYQVVAMDNGIKMRRVEGSTEQMAARRLMIESGSYTPAIGDKVTLGGRLHVVNAVEPVAPFGDPLFYKVYVGG